ncbi:hypothetical protein CPB83DRAFT_898068 [Crepidotus variabilis]|uniref:Uncharacterized protein n=1 Tax=Crepidotus variabilis TaxID=179855 RepID=A0A9P6E827_9AGAR|nr:hypothetical protein CPB83DRAFT_898068 [Crepidotus variabilis]
MTDLTVLVSPLPLYPNTGDFTFGRKTKHKPIMVTLETEVDEDLKRADMEADNSEKPRTSDPDFIRPPPVFPTPKRGRSPRPVDHSLLSPPPNTWKSRPRHRPTRSQSAPPERTLAIGTNVSPEGGQYSTLQSPVSAVELPSTNILLGLGAPLQRTAARSFSSQASTKKTGELVRPPPPLLRPTTFWRKTRRSGVTGASYSPSSHLIRRSTYIAAGLAFDSPVHDLSALCVESRVGFIVVPPEDNF